ncbi:hypothetical protein Ahy_B05g074951 [Arachis hypogaea]|uniref:Uncharacterized protein n=1 Tax=Arachis hypogaea TaxID=3818 RepID=A0A444Z060_ARAHY|nr:hypothetical protein Ahy_B05g074951 [Arachis hypogaea]
MATMKEKMPNKGNSNSVKENESRKERYCGRNGIWYPGKCPRNEQNRFPEKVDYNDLNLADKEIFDSVKNIFLATLTRNVLDMSVEGEENRKKFKRTFVVFIQKCFLLPTMVSVASPIHKPPIFHVDNIRK